MLTARASAQRRFARELEELRPTGRGSGTTSKDAQRDGERGKKARAGFTG